jgi:hypothetical protein
MLYLVTSKMHAFKNKGSMVIVHKEVYKDFRAQNLHYVLSFLSLGFWENLSSYPSLENRLSLPPNFILT